MASAALVELFERSSSNAVLSLQTSHSQLSLCLSCEPHSSIVVLISVQQWRLPKEVHCQQKQTLPQRLYFCQLGPRSLLVLGLALSAVGDTVCAQWCCVATRTSMMLHLNYWQDSIPCADTLLLQTMMLTLPSLCADPTVVCAYVACLCVILVIIIFIYSFVAIKVSST